jgi:hypothetical protein
MLGAGIISLQAYCRDRYIRPAALQGSEAEQLGGTGGLGGNLQAGDYYGRKLLVGAPGL